MLRYASILICKGVIEDVSIFETSEGASAWVATLRDTFGWGNTSSSLIWDTLHQIPIQTKETGDQEEEKLGE
jgi:hypothetical protein